MVKSIVAMRSSNISEPDGPRVRFTVDACFCYSALIYSHGVVGGWRQVLVVVKGGGEGWEVLEDRGWDEMDGWRVWV